jgi:redox-sensitive bicupin YhaK (pirin superfamily)
LYSEALIAEMQGPFVGEAPADISRLDEEYRQGRFPHMSELECL